MRTRRLSRRQFLAASAVAVTSPTLFAAPSKRNDGKIRLGFSLYGMRNLKTNDALTTCAKIGYQSVELVSTAEWPCDPALLPSHARKDVKKQVEDSGMHLSSLMENLHVVADRSKHRKNLDRLKAACELAHQLSPDNPPLIETVVGGRANEWDRVKTKMVAGLKDWAKVFEESDATLAIKAHVGGALHRPNDAVWLVKEVESKNMRLNYDFSHFQLYDFDLEESLTTMLDHTVFIHAKDTKGKAGKFQFLLPGDGNIDYVKYASILKRHKYPGAVMVEVSGQIHGKPGYDPVAAAKRGFQNLSKHFPPV